MNTLLKQICFDCLKFYITQTLKITLGQALQKKIITQSINSNFNVKQ